MNRLVYLRKLPAFLSIGLRIVLVQNYVLNATKILDMACLNPVCFIVCFTELYVVYMDLFYRWNAFAFIVMVYVSSTRKNI
jgi:hypothetical protein